MWSWCKGHNISKTSIKFKPELMLGNHYAVDSKRSSMLYCTDSECKLVKVRLVLVRPSYRPIVRPWTLWKEILFIAHLSRRLKMSYCDHLSFVVVRPSGGYFTISCCVFFFRNCEQLERIRSNTVSPEVTLSNWLSGLLYCVIWKNTEVQSQRQGE